ncbi:Rha family transcriptional regulator [Dyadobacter subterraneus]|nr:Rha family transcriptional regulator [Dyadobacter subterraneus]
MIFVINEVINKSQIGMYFVSYNNGKPTTSSSAVADQFGKSHNDILRSIEKLECSKEFKKSNFFPSPSLWPSGKADPSILITREGLVLLVMSLESAAPVSFRENVIAKFDGMASFL